jgi:hypothetical protein
MTNKIPLVAIVIVSLLTSYAILTKNRDASENIKEIIFDDNFISELNGEVVIEERDFAGYQEAISQQIEISRKKTRSRQTALRSAQCSTATATARIKDLSSRTRALRCCLCAPPPTVKERL